MFKLGQFVQGQWVEYSHAAVYEHRTTGNGKARLEIGVPGGEANLLRTLATCAEPPYYILYVLVVPRGEGEPGRYQSPLIQAQELDHFLRRYAEFFRADGRAHLWVHSPSSQATLAWDRHNIIHAYGPLSCFEDALGSIGFLPGTLTIPRPHEHYYRQECDADAVDILARFDWRHSKLCPGDDD